MYWSYWVQFVLSVTISLALAILLMGHQSDSSQRSALSRIQRQEAYFVETGIEFQKAQCYLMIAVQIAAIVELRRGDFNAESLAQATNTMRFLVILARGGFLPTTLVLVLLWLHDYKSLYTLGLTICSVLLATIVTLMGIQPFRPPEYFAFSKSYSPHCHNMNPVSFCSINTIDADLATLSYHPEENWVLLGAWILVLLIAVDQYFFQGVRTFWAEASTAEPKLKIFASLTNGNWKRLLKWNRRTLKPPTGLIIWIGFLGLLLVPTAIFFFIGLLAFSDEFLEQSKQWSWDIPLDLTSWRFGQIVAITVWAPVIFQFLYLQFRESHQLVRDVVAARPARLPEQTLISRRRHGRRTSAVADGLPRLSRAVGTARP